MTGRTHDLAAFTAINYIVTTGPLIQMSLATTFVSLGANLIGGIAPDLDQPTANLWNRLPAGSIIGRLITPIMGGHRFISHSLLGFALWGFGLKFLLGRLHSVLLVDMNIVWWTFMIGYASHLIMDTFTKEGVPWLFPIPFRFGIPPLKFLRIQTGGVVEKAMIFPSLIVLNGYLIYHYYGKYLDLLRHYIK